VNISKVSFTQIRIRNDLQSVVAQGKSCLLTFALLFISMSYYCDSAKTITPLVIRIEREFARNDPTGRSGEDSVVIIIKIECGFVSLSEGTVVHRYKWVEL
jgi:hypothetical protein